MYRHLTPLYFEHFSSSLRTWLKDSFKILKMNPEVAGVQADLVQKLRMLYGESAFPDALIRFFPLTFDHPHLAVDDPDAVNVEAPLQDAWAAFQFFILRSEDHPVITRFWLFSSCVRGLFWAHLFLAPTQVFRLGTVTPQEQQQHRSSSKTEAQLTSGPFHSEFLGSVAVPT